MGYEMTRKKRRMEQWQHPEKHEMTKIEEDEANLDDGSPVDSTDSELETAGTVKPKKRKGQGWSPTNREFRYKQFVGRQDKLYILKKDENDKLVEEELADLVVIEKIYENIDDNTFELLLKYWYLNQWRELSIKRSQLQLNELTKLLDYGIDVPNYKASQIARFLSLQEKDAPLHKSHRHLGWADRKGELVYKHQELLGRNLLDSSTYEGNLLLQKGTFEGWKQVIKQEVLGHTPLEFALTCGFAAPLVSLIAKLVDLEVLIFHAFGDSAQGKTTAGRVFVSPFGLPSKREGGLILQWLATKNGLVGQIKQKHGLPLVLDEASMNRMSDFTDILYLLAEGREKARMTKEIQERERASWSGVFFSTAEHSLHQKSNQNSGLLVRLQEKGNVPWTRSAENATEIKEGLLKHYGHAGPKFIEFLLKTGKDAILNIWKKWSEICYGKMVVKDGLSRRIADKFALILATADLMNQCFDFSVNKDGILEFLLEMDQENAKGRDLGERAYQYLRQIVVQHQMRFIKADDKPNGEIWGKMTRGYDRKIEVAFLQEPFKKLLSDGGFDDYSVVLRKLKEKGYLDHERDKNTRKRNVNPTTNKRELVYCINFDNSFEKLLNGVTLSSSQVQTAPRKSKGSNKVSLTEDHDFPEEP
ncbi:DUF927 domain-containing protein [Brevibacillus sp. AG]|uniref:DUF927 domain-containing protein n=1 Tax=Brevibacillus sp. AG TaxID=3020891 RepID=UPI00232EE9F8|nr:DUF927 domain-containing protein [Brevibacillus sp. AG]MDC0765258.1 DUF927 domain-containing protein [Brevibacillus sp. AG]